MYPGALTLNRGLRVHHIHAFSFSNIHGSRENLRFSMISYIFLIRAYWPRLGPETHTSGLGIEDWGFYGH